MTTVNRRPRSVGLSVCLLLLVACSAPQADQTTPLGPDVGATYAVETVIALLTATVPAPKSTPTPGLPSATPIPQMDTPTAAATTAPPTPSPTPTVPVYANVPVFGDNGNLEGSVVVPGLTTLPDPLVFRTALVFQVRVRDPNAGPEDGAGIATVAFTLTDLATGAIVHEQTEQNAGYCMFGGGEPTCNVWRLADHGNLWPNGTPITLPGDYSVQISVQPTDSSRTSAFWNFNFRIEP